MHVHLWDKQNVLPQYLAHGITGVRDMGSDYARTRAWRRAIESGKAIGPHVVTCGPAVNGTPSDNPKLPVDIIRDPEQARREFDRLDNMHVDFVKILSTLPRDAYFALAERARHWDLPFVGHLPNDVTIDEAIEARQASIEHVFGFPVKDERKCREALDRCAMFGTRLTPSLTLWHRMAAEDPTVREQLPYLDLLVKRAEQAGVKLLAGTDTGDPGTQPGITLHQELSLLVQGGLTPLEALRTATLEPARFLGWDENLGTLKKGMLADLVLLDANPLSDIRNVSKIAGVAFEGRYFTSHELRTLARIH
jgi:predicted amidohydrolase YtcJ